ncbi:hypothetical protein [Streptomyces sp. NPDC088847]|uniref:hypothetical protein n=1 Tax=Streptomyces sp. NPDC088847 TaxID=3365909 RepID=UPI003819FEB4
MLTLAQFVVAEPEHLVAAELQVAVTGHGGGILCTAGYSSSAARVVLHAVDFQHHAPVPGQQHEVHAEVLQGTLPVLADGLRWHLI